MRFVGYYNIVNDYIKLFIIVCEKLSPCLRSQMPWITGNFLIIPYFKPFFSLYCLGYLDRF